MVLLRQAKLLLLDHVAHRHARKARQHAQVRRVHVALPHIAHAQGAQALPIGGHERHGAEEAQPTPRQVQGRVCRQPGAFRAEANAGETATKEQPADCYRSELQNRTGGWCILGVA